MTPKTTPAVEGTCAHQLKLVTHAAPADRRLPLRQRSLRDRRSACLGVLLPLHTLPAPERHGRLGPGAHRAGVVAHRRRRGARGRAPARRGLAEVLLHRLRQRALEPRPERCSELRSVRLGTFDADPGIRPQWRQFSRTPRPGNRFPTTVCRATPRENVSVRGGCASTSTARRRSRSLPARRFHMMSSSSLRRTGTRSRHSRLFPTSLPRRES